MNLQIRKTTIGKGGALRASLLPAFLALSAFIIAAASGAVNWPFQFCCTVLAYATAGALGTRSTERWLLVSFLISLPWLLIYGGTALIHEQSHVYPIVFASIVSSTGGSIASHRWIKDRSYSLTLICAIVIFGVGGGALGMPNWIAATLGTPENSRSTSKTASLTFADPQQSERQFRIPEDFEGKVVVLDFWSTSCAACFAQFPKIENLNASYEGDPSVEIIVVNLKEPGESAGKAKSMMDKYNYNFRSVYSEITVSDAYEMFGFRGLPAAVVYDKEGKIVFTGIPEFQPHVFINNIARIIDRHVILTD